MEVRVGTWNLENLFLPGGQFGPPPAVFEQKLDGLTGTIAQMAPDLLGVQEVGAPDALDQLVPGSGAHDLRLVRLIDTLHGDHA